MTFYFPKTYDPRGQKILNESNAHGGHYSVPANYSVEYDMDDMRNNPGNHDAVKRHVFQKTGESKEKVVQGGIGAHRKAFASTRKKVGTVSKRGWNNYVATHHPSKEKQKVSSHSDGLKWIIDKHNSHSDT
jgi:hypothetical protein